MPQTDETNRNLVPMDEDCSFTPFPHMQSALGMLRDDQVPRFLGALTNPENLLTETLPLRDLVAVQDRVSTEKVTSMARGNPVAARNYPVVVRINRPYIEPSMHAGTEQSPHIDLIADGHHRASALWLAGEETAVVRFKDLRATSNAMKAKSPAVDAKVIKVNEEHGLVLGWAIVSTDENGEYFDTQGDHIPADAMLKASVSFAKSSRTMDLQHSGILNDQAPKRHGTVVFIMPMTHEIAKSFGMTTQIEGLMIGAAPDDPEILAKFKDGTLTGFSIGGGRVADQEV